MNNKNNTVNEEVRPIVKIGDYYFRPYPKSVTEYVTTPEVKEACRKQLEYERTQRERSKQWEEDHKLPDRFEVTIRKNHRMIARRMIGDFKVTAELYRLMEMQQTLFMKMAALRPFRPFHYLGAILQMPEDKTKELSNTMVEILNSYSVE